MKILFLGGTQFVGRHMVAEALKRGHQVTLFNRGQTSPELFPEAEKLRGDRDNHLEALRGRRWDAVVDVNGYVPRLVRYSCEALRDAADRYLFISTGSVYDFAKINLDSPEESPLLKLEDETTEEWFGPAYGGLKVLCENVVREKFPGRFFIPRLGVQAGPYDPTDRVTYWVSRAAQGAEVLAPGRADLPIQFLDTRDLSLFSLDSLEKGRSGIYNCFGHAGPWSVFLATCKKVSGSNALFTWVDDFQFLRESIEMRSRTFGAIPMATPPNCAHLFSDRADVRARALGLKYRALSETVRDVLAWERTRRADEPRVAGLTPEQEHDALAKWHARG